MLFDSEKRIDDMVYITILDPNEAVFLYFQQEIQKRWDMELTRLAGERCHVQWETQENGWFEFFYEFSSDRLQIVVPQQWHRAVKKFLEERLHIAPQNTWRQGWRQTMRYTPYSKMKQTFRQYVEQEAKNRDPEKKFKIELEPFFLFYPEYRHGVAKGLMRIGIACGPVQLVSTTLAYDIAQYEAGMWDAWLLPGEKEELDKDVCNLRRWVYLGTEVVQGGTNPVWGILQADRIGNRQIARIDEYITMRECGPQNVLVPAYQYRKETPVGKIETGEIRVQNAYLPTEAHPKLARGGWWYEESSEETGHLAFRVRMRGKVHSRRTSREFFCVIKGFGGVNVFFQHFVGLEEGDEIEFAGELMLAIMIPKKKKKAEREV